MSIKILVIDDQPDYKLHQFDTTLKEKIDQALSSISGKQFSDPIYLTDNREESLKNILKNKYHLIILDWNFPKGYPTGEETLTVLQKDLSFPGPIIVHTRSKLDFSKYRKAGKVHFCWSGQGTVTLGNLIEQLSPTYNSIAKTEEPWLFKYFENFDDIKPHIYHSECGGIGPLSGDEFKRGIKMVSMLTTNWNSNETDPSKRLQADAPMGRVIRDIENLCAKDIPVFIQGESGTGKELVAKLLHHHRLRREYYDNITENHCYQEEDKDYYLAINCGAFPSKDLLNLELFGSLPGAFTDAIDKAGIFEQVSYRSGKQHMLGDPVAGGTVFLDEIALMKKTSQAFLLRVLQEKSVLRKGNDLTKFGMNQAVRQTINGKDLPIDSKLFGPIPVNFRLITATNEDLMDMVEEGKFRLDMYFRIVRGYIFLPSLAERGPEDFNLLFQYFIHKFNEVNRSRACLENKDGFVAGESRDLLISLYENFSWKGNIRELEGVVDVMVAYVKDNADGSGHPLTSHDLPGFLFNRYLSKNH